ncbi:hypothetical protein MOPEL_135_01140 [Mobilicoccus pelagius NBRC 104925]|uniref:Uncharacterized protein n=1 Tax=Mobilicoccus pelagius NBRC 104925 TaxID=1089455 RepID=H5UVW8_9MICO|nr:hypothetical protein MOPEL_135_01140 [Mobilicoccus pelagius NBRC 104925]
MAPPFFRATLAAAAAGALLTTSTSGYAAWQEAATDAREPAPLEAGPSTVELLGADDSPRRVDAGDHGTEIRAVVGERIRVTLPVTIHTRGAGGMLRVIVPPARGDAPLAAELAATPPRLEVVPQDGDAPLRVSPEGAAVPAAADGHTYLVRWTTATRPTRDGRPAGARNAWGSGTASLQGAGVGPRQLTVTLTRGDEAGGDEAGGNEAGEVRTVVPAIAMDTAALRVTTAPDGSTLSGLGTRPLSLRPTSVALHPVTPLTEARARELRTDARLGVEIGWGTDDCATRWTVPVGGLARATRASPRPARAEAAPTENLPAGGGRRTCVRLLPGVARDDLVRRHAGRTLEARTTWTATSPAPATWTSTATTTERLPIPLPAPTPASCRPIGNRIAVRWAWPTTSKTPPARVAGTTGIERWALLARPAGTGTWTQVAEIRDGDGREHRLPLAALRGVVRTGPAELRVRAVAGAGAERSSGDAVRTWTVSARDGRPTCVATTPARSSVPTSPAAGTAAPGPTPSAAVATPTSGPRSTAAPTRGGTR